VGFDVTTLHLGVIELPHPGGDKTGLTTGDLAEILESKYGLYSVFLDANLEKIEEQIAESLRDAIDNVLAGAPLPENPFADAQQEIVSDFVTFLDTSEIEKIGVRGTPTEAALKGVNHRLKLRKGPRRPSFIDTGALRASTAAWVDDGTEAVVPHGGAA